MLQDDHKCRGTSMERVQSGFKVKVGSRTKWCTMSQENEEVHVSVSLQYSENLVNSLKDPKRVKQGPLCRKASRIRWEILNS